MPNTIVIRNLDDSLAKNFATMVKFEWGENFSQQSRYIAWTDDVTVSSQLYTSVPELEIKIEKQHGGAEDAPSVITIPKTYSPIDKLARPFPHSDCRVTILECDPSDPSNTVGVLFFGYVSKILAGKFGSNSMTEITVLGLKAQGNFSLGFPANTDCDWNLFDAHCKEPALEYEATLQAVSEDGMTLTVSSPTLVTTTTGTP